MGGHRGLLHLVQQGGDWTGPQSAQATPRCTKCNSPPINGQCTNLTSYYSIWHYNYLWSLKGQGSSVQPCKFNGAMEGPSRNILVVTWRNSGHFEGWTTDGCTEPPKNSTGPARRSYTRGGGGVITCRRVSSGNRNAAAHPHFLISAYRPSDATTVVNTYGCCAYYIAFIHTTVGSI